MNKDGSRIEIDGQILILCLLQNSEVIWLLGNKVFPFIWLFMVKLTFYPTSSLKPLLIFPASSNVCPSVTGFFFYFLFPTILCSKVCWFSCSFGNSLYPCFQFFFLTFFRVQFFTVYNKRMVFASSSDIFFSGVRVSINLLQPNWKQNCGLILNYGIFWRNWQVILKFV